MKKVRFVTPEVFNKMEEPECHSPRPFTERQILTNIPDIYNPKILPFSNNPVHLFESSNSSPYPSMNKTKLAMEQESLWSPSNDLELSVFDSSTHEPRQPLFRRTNPNESRMEVVCAAMDTADRVEQTRSSVLCPIEDKLLKPPNILVKDDDFFIKRDNLNKIHFSFNPMRNETKQVVNKENNPPIQKAQMLQVMDNSFIPSNIINGDCNCHHCNKVTVNSNINKKTMLHTQIQMGSCNPNFVSHIHRCNHCKCDLPPASIRYSCCNRLSDKQELCKTCDEEQLSHAKMDAIAKKTWAIEKYEQNKKSDLMEIEKQTNLVREKREPTVSDLFKIIKLQNEQLQLLQEKVDKFISVNQQTNNSPLHNCISEQVAIETVSNEQHKISIGVMTSFEMVRTSTIVNKEVIKSSENAQIQCNRSQISIKELLSQTQAPNLNFLDGIPTAGKNISEVEHIGCVLGHNAVQPPNEEKTLNELSLYNVQVENAITPLMSPEQSLYLDVRDYSESEESDDQSNVGWTYYNKVMTHVNGVLQDSDMPSSASAMHRNMKQQMQTVQMQIDKTNVSVTKRVKFGDDPLGIHQPHIYAASSDTSLKMNQLAAKYLKTASPVPEKQRTTPRPITTPIDVSFATRNYMERHKLLQSAPISSKPQIPPEMPRFLDITALKQQPKLL